MQVKCPLSTFGGISPIIISIQNRMLTLVAGFAHAWANINLYHVTKINKEGTAKKEWSETVSQSETSMATSYIMEFNSDYYATGGEF